jgi:glucosamine-6-phosphate deaminase
MRLIVKPDLESWAYAAARLVADQLNTKPKSVLGFATGETTTHLHRALVTLAQHDDIDFSQATTFQVDEYVGVQRNNPASCYARMEAQLFKNVPLRAEAIHFPDVLAESLEQACINYEALIQQHGGIDLQILGIGANGHIGFNEPGTSFDSITHITDIAPQTVAAKASMFGSSEAVPRHGMTMGIKTIMHARQILLLAYGEGKAAIMAQALTGPVTPDVPASVLQLHPNLIVVVDNAAGKELSLP